MQLEDQWRKNEANIRRKAAGAQTKSSAALSSSEDAPKSPGANTGAMDDLLKKLRDAKPDTRDQRDRRRRARLKDRHQVRVASGQQIPEIGVNMDNEDDDASDAGKGLLSPTSEGGESTQSVSVASPTETRDTAGDDVADRAAAMLEGLQGGSSVPKDGSLVVRRRRENADSERERRRRRRQQASTASSTRSDDAGGLMSPTIPEDGEEGVRRGSVVSAASASVAGEEDEGGPRTPVTIVSPPSPEGKRGEGEEGRKMLTPPPE